MQVLKVNQVDGTPDRVRAEAGYIEVADLSGDTKFYIWPDCAAALYYSDPTGTPTQQNIPALTANTWKVVDYEKEEVCNAGVTWAGSGSPGTWAFIPSVVGIWNINCMVELTLPGTWAACDYSLGLFKSGALYKLLDRVATGTTGKALVQGSARIVVDGATDSIEIKVMSSVNQPATATWSGYVDAAFDTAGACAACVA